MEIQQALQWAFGIYILATLGVLGLGILKGWWRELALHELLAGLLVWPLLTTRTVLRWALRWGRALFELLRATGTEAVRLLLER